MSQQAIGELMFGQRVAFVEIFCGAMELTLGVRAVGLCAPDGIDKLYPVGGIPWDCRGATTRSVARLSWIDSTLGCPTLRRPASSSPLYPLLSGQRIGRAQRNE